MEAQFSYIQGIAGTGKSYLLQTTAQQDRTCQLCATTGIAAVNLGAGTTIHSFLWYYDTDSLLDAWTSGRLDFRLGEVYGKMGIRRILLDEVSMLPASNLSVLCLAIDRLNTTLREKGKAPFGLTLAGDFAQLPPVRDEDGFAFESEHWEKFQDNTTILRHIYRQKDREFIEALQLVREGRGKEASTFFKPMMHQMVDAHFEGTTLYPYNKQVDHQNAYRLSLIKTDALQFRSERTGKSRPEWKNIPETLQLKKDALVMVLANKRDQATGEMEYANGDLGWIRDIRTQGKDIFAIVELQRGHLVEVEKVERENTQPGNDGKRRCVGTIKYMPLRLAYASTVHKSQGLTLDNVQVDIRSKFFSQTPGMAYVALSRARTAGGLRLICGEKTFAQRCTVNEKIKRFL